MEEKLEEKAKRIQEEIEDFKREIENMDKTTDWIKNRIGTLIHSWARIGNDIKELEERIYEAKTLMEEISRD